MTGQPLDPAAIMAAQFRRVLDLANADDPIGHARNREAAMDYFITHLPALLDGVDRLAAALAAAQERETVRVEYAIARKIGPRFIILAGPHSENQWNETMTLREAADRWYAGADVVRREVRSCETSITDWTLAGEGAADGVRKCEYCGTPLTEQGCAWCDDHPGEGAADQPSSVFGPDYTPSLPPLRIDMQPDEDADPKRWHAFLGDASRAVADVMEAHGFAALAGERPVDQPESRHDRWRLVDDQPTCECGKPWPHGEGAVDPTPHFDGVSLTCDPETCEQHPGPSQGAADQPHGTTPAG